MNINDILLNTWDMENKKEASRSSEGHASLIQDLDPWNYCVHTLL